MRVQVGAWDENYQTLAGVNAASAFGAVKEQRVEPQRGVYRDTKDPDYQTLAGLSDAKAFQK